MTVQSSGSERDNRGDCPGWCVADHGSQHHPEDQWHESVIVHVPIIECLTYFAGSGWQLEEVGVTLSVLLEQHTAVAKPLVVFGPGDDRDRNYRLSPESTRRLIHALEDQLKTLRL